jgi:hypothetical protein
MPKDISYGGDVKLGEAGEMVQVDALKERERERERERKRERKA